MSVYTVGLGGLVRKLPRHTGERTSGHAFCAHKRMECATSVTSLTGKRVWLAFPLGFQYHENDSL